MFFGPWTVCTTKHIRILNIQRWNRLSKSKSTGLKVKVLWNTEWAVYMCVYVYFRYGGLWFVRKDVWCGVQCLGIGSSPLPSLGRDVNFSHDMSFSVARMMGFRFWGYTPGKLTWNPTIGENCRCFSFSKGVSLGSKPLVLGGLAV